MRQATYKNLNNTPNSVDYIIFYNCVCVFSGTKNDGTSTVNAAERVVKAISDIEKKPLKFYDLQTQKGYGYYSPGEYSFSLLNIKDQDNPKVLSWRPQQISLQILEAFKEHIGPNPRLKRF